jgi:hypothetical protein
MSSPKSTSTAARAGARPVPVRGRPLALVAAGRHVVGVMHAARLAPCSCMAATRSSRSRTRSTRSSFESPSPKQVGVHEPQPAEAPLGRAQAADVGQHELGGVAHDHASIAPERCTRAPTCRPVSRDASVSERTSSAVATRRRPMRSRARTWAGERPVLLPKISMGDAYYLLTRSRYWPVARVDLDPLALFDEERDVDRGARGERRRLGRAAGRVALHARLAARRPARRHVGGRSTPMGVAVEERHVDQEAVRSSTWRRRRPCRRGR